MPNYFYKRLTYFRPLLSCVALILLTSAIYAIELPQEQRPRVLMVKPAAQKIVVSLRPYALLVESIKREGDEVSVLIEGGASAHDFQLRPSHLKKIAEADLVIWSGQDAEPTLAKALKNKKKQLKLMELSELDLLHTNEHHIENNHDAYIDPHIWFSQQNALIIAKAMADALYYPDEALNNIKMRSAMMKAFEKAKPQKQSHNNKVLLVYHNAYAYLEKDLNIQHDFVINESHNSKPSLQHWNTLKEKLNIYKTEQRSLCVITLPGFEHSSEAKQLENLLNNTKMKDKTILVEIDPLATKAQYKDYYDFYMDSRNRLIGCMN